MIPGGVGFVASLYLEVNEFMKTRKYLLLGFCGLLGAASLSACSGMSRQDRSTAAGAGVGAVGGAVLTGGSAAGTVGGAAVGGIIGHEIGK